MTQHTSGESKVPYENDIPLLNRNGERTPAGERRSNMKTPEKNSTQNVNKLSTSAQVGEDIRVSTRLQRGTRNLKQGKYSNPNQSGTAGSNTRRLSNGAAAGAQGLWANADLIDHRTITTID